jgi:uncharacterized protein (DUF302 family)
MDLLSRQGLGVLSEIDVRATLKEERDVEMEHYVTSGPCSPLPTGHPSGLQAVLDNLDRS